MYITLAPPTTQEIRRNPMLPPHLLISSIPLSPLLTRLGTFKPLDRGQRTPAMCKNNGGDGEMGGSMEFRRISWVVGGANVRQNFGQYSRHRDLFNHERKSKHSLVFEIIWMYKS
jgi:hypothetical protein